MSGNAWRIAATVTLLVALTAATLAWFAAGRFAWGQPEIPKAQCEALDPASVASVDSLPRYRVRVADAIIREPQNTWSNLAFVFAGALIATHDRRMFPRLLGMALIALGIASGLYHASLLPSWRTVDVAMMGWVCFALCCHAYAAARSGVNDRRGSPRRAFWVGVAGSALAMTAAIFRNDVRIAGVKPFSTSYTTFAGIAVVFVIAAIAGVKAVRTHPTIRVPVARLGALTLVVAAAVFCQLNDRTGRRLCAPDSVIQAHAVWHVLMASAAVVAYDIFAMFENRAPLFGQVI